MLVECGEPVAEWRGGGGGSALRSHAGGGAEQATGDDWKSAADCTGEDAISEACGRDG
jgi:hypothetical protein